MSKKLTNDQKIVQRRIYWLLLTDLLDMSKSTKLSAASVRAQKPLLDAALQAATKIAVENY